MSFYSIKDISTSTERYKLYILPCNSGEIAACIAFIQAQNITVINIGKEVANFIDTLNDYRYLNIDIDEYAKKLLDKSKAQINDSGNDVIAVYNLGVLLEPALQLNAVQLLKDFSKSAAVIIIWENQSELPDQLNWQTQKQHYFLDFSETHLKKLQYAI